MVKYGIIKADNFVQNDYHAIIKNNFQGVSRAGVGYKVVCAIDNPLYFEQGNFDYIFSQSEYNAWIVDTPYIIIPNLIIPEIKEQIALVEDVLFQEQFIYVDNLEEVTTRNNNVGNVVASSVIFTPCKVLKWEEGDNLLLQGIVDLYNSKNTGVTIDFDCFFNTKQEMEDWKNANTYP